MAVSDYGLILAYRPMLAAGDKRYWYEAGSASEPTTFNDTAFEDDYCWRFNGITTQMQYHHFHRSPGLTTADTYPIQLAIDDRIVIGFEVVPIISVQTAYTRIFTVQGNAGVRVNLRNDSVNTNLRLQTTDANGTTTDGTAWANGASYRKFELEIERTGESELTVKLYRMEPARTLKDTIVHTVTGGDKTWKFNVVGWGHELGDSSKSDTYDVRFGRVFGSWSDGTIDTDDKQNPWYDGTGSGWGPSWYAHQFPTSDVTNEWSSGDYADVDDAAGSFSDGGFGAGTGTEDAGQTATTARKKFLLGWNDVSIADGTNIQAVVIHGTHANFYGDDADLMAYLASRCGTDEVTGEFNPESSTSPMYNTHGIFRRTPQGDRFTEDSINETDWGIDKPASGSATDGYVSAVWMDILYGGSTLVEDDPTYVACPAGETRRVFVD